MCSTGFAVLREIAVSEVIECGPLAFFAFTILQQGEYESSHQYLTKGKRDQATPTPFRDK